MLDLVVHTPLPFGFRIQTKCGKIWTGITPNMDALYAVLTPKFLEKVSRILTKIKFFLNFALTLLKLTHFMPLVSFYAPGKHQKTYGFLRFSGGIERNQWH